MSNARVDSAFGRLPRQHVEEVRGVAERRIRLRSVRRPPACGPYVATRLAICAGQPHGLAIVRLRRVVGRVRIVVAEHRRQRPQRVHAVGRRQLLHQPQDGSRQRRARRPAATADRPARRGSAAGRARAGSRPPRTSRRVRQIVDVVAVVGEHAAIAVEIADGRRRRDDVFEAGLGLGVSGHAVMISRRGSRLTVRAAQNKARETVDGFLTATAESPTSRLPAPSAPRRRR